jgi:hypothetical protein
MSNTIWHGLADEWELATYEEDLSYSEMLIYDKCAQELRALTDKYSGSSLIVKTEDQKSETSPRFADARER